MPVGDVSIWSYSLILKPEQETSWDFYVSTMIIKAYEIQKVFPKTSYGQ